MEHMDLFDTFDKRGWLRLPERAVPFGEIPWVWHQAFDGVELKHIVTAGETGGQFSFHLVRIAPGKAIGRHIHQTQLETHEVIAGGGVCASGGAELAYGPGVISILPKGLPHEVRAGNRGFTCLPSLFRPLCDGRRWDDPA